MPGKLESISRSQVGREGSGWEGGGALRYQPLGDMAGQFAAVP